MMDFAEKGQLLNSAYGRVLRSAKMLNTGGKKSQLTFMATHEMQSVGTCLISSLPLQEIRLSQQ